MKMLSLLLAPVVFLLKRLRFTGKFALIGLLASVTIIWFMVTLAVQMRSDLANTDRERLGLEIHTLAYKATTATQEYTGIFLGANGSLESFKSQLDERREYANRALRKVHEAVADAPLQQLAAHWKKVEDLWQAYSAPAKPFERNELATAHQALMLAQQEFLHELADASGLSRDSDPRAAYLAEATMRTLPEIANQIAEVRNTGTLVLGVPGFAKEWRRMNAMLDAIQAEQATLGVQLARAGRDSSLAGDMDEAIKAISAENEKFIEATRQHILSGSREMPANEFARIGLRALHAFNELADDSIVSELRGIVGWRSFSLSARFWLMNLLALGMVVLLAYIGISIYLAISQAVEELAEGTRRAGAGDLAYRIPYSTQDELRTVAERFNDMLGSLDGVVERVATTTAAVESAASSLNASARAVSEESARQSEASAAMAATMEQMTVGISEIARFTQDAENMAAQSGRASSAGEQLSSRTEEEIQRISEAVQQSSVVIDELVENSQRIRTIVTTIKEIAEQTNLLALNAAIEAARAGETGRGFAVVADEVRKLAERTSRATLEITQMIETIQRGTEQAVTSMQQGVARVGEGVGLTREAGAAMRDIQQSSARLVSLVADIALSLREQSATSTDIARNIERVAQMAEQNNVSSQSTLATTHTLDNLASRLTSQIRQIRGG